MTKKATYQRYFRQALNARYTRADAARYADEKANPLDEGSDGYSHSTTPAIQRRIDAGS